MTDAECAIGVVGEVATDVSQTRPWEWHGMLWIGLVPVVCMVWYGGMLGVVWCGVVRVAR